MKTFLSYSEILFSVKFYLQQFPPNENFKNPSFPPLFLPPLILKISVPPDFVELKNPVPPSSQRGGSCYEFSEMIS